MVHQLDVSEEDLETMKGLARHSEHPAVRGVFENALRFVDDPGVRRATVRLLNAMAQAKEAEVALLWLGPVFALVCGIVLIQVLKGVF